MRLLAIMIAVLGVIALSGSSFAATIHAATCNQSDVQAAINNASDNDTVSVPAGTCTWYSLNTYRGRKPAVVIDNKSIILRGAGVGQTVINDSTTSGWEDAAVLMMTKPSRITNMTFIYGGDATGVIAVYSTSNDSLAGFRIDHCEFYPANPYVISTQGLAYGVIDHCSFEPLSENMSFSYMQFKLDDRAAWSRPSTLGTSRNTFIEDCTFTGGSIGDGSGSRPVTTDSGVSYVFRHNVIHQQSMDMHGLCGTPAGTRSWEVYDNVFDTTRTIYRWFFIRSGTGVVFNNVMTVSGSARIDHGVGFSEYRVDTPYTNPCPGNMTCACTYPALDQIGRGTDQILDPAYFWNNTLNGAPIIVQVDDIANPGNCEGAYEQCGIGHQNMSNFIQVGRDYYVDSGEKPGYAPYTYPHPLTLEASSCGSRADSNLDGQIAMSELLSFIGQWKVGNATLAELLQAIGLWKRGC